MKRPLVVLALLALAGCGGGENVVVRASLDEAGAQPIADLPVRLLPYDRQAILDSLAAEREEPEPRLPKDAVERLRSLAAAEDSVKQRGDTAALARMQAERRQLAAQLDAARKARQKWLDDIREDYEDAVRKKVSGIGEKADTTDAAGRAAFGIEEGKWWAVAQYVLPEVVLEWKVPVRLRGDSTVVRLTRENAKEEPLF